MIKIQPTGSWLSYFIEDLFPAFCQFDTLRQHGDVFLPCFPTLYTKSKPSIGTKAGAMTPVIQKKFPVSIELGWKDSAAQLLPRYHEHLTFSFMGYVTIINSKLR